MDLASALDSSNSPRTPRPCVTVGESRPIDPSPDFSVPRTSIGPDLPRISGIFFCLVSRDPRIRALEGFQIVGSKRVCGPTLVLRPNPDPTGAQFACTRYPPRLSGLWFLRVESKERE